MPVSYRDVLYLYYLKEQSLKEIEQNFGITSSAIKSRLLRQCTIHVRILLPFLCIGK
jgi:DNA-directed RNA polymerase specialized sigma24 family protein